MKGHDNTGTQTKTWVCDKYHCVLTGLCRSVCLESIAIWHFILWGIHLWSIHKSCHHQSKFIFKFRCFLLIFSIIFHLRYTCVNLKATFFEMPLLHYSTDLVFVCLWTCDRKWQEMLLFIWYLWTNDFWWNNYAKNPHHLKCMLTPEDLFAKSVYVCLWSVWGACVINGI